jgi:hypothetical protein
VFIDVASTKLDLLTELANRGLTISPDALKPLDRIDFGKLVAIHDHEEHFLRTVFVDSLVSANKTRVDEDGGPSSITAPDVRTAMLMLGAAAETAPEGTLSAPNKSIIKDVCPFCATMVKP